MFGATLSGWRASQSAEMERFLRRCEADVAKARGVARVRFGKVQRRAKRVRTTMRRRDAVVRE